MDLNVAIKFSREIRHAVYRPRKFQAHFSACSCKQSEAKIHSKDKPFKK